jgi:glycosyltransferase involved in cell wall biosynthesis
MVTLTQNMSQPLLYLLLPVKDGADYLAPYLQSAANFADGVIALDDGSTDGTVEMLRDNPLVKALQSHAPRIGFAEWNDSQNRNELLVLAEPFHPKWAMFLDCDERFDAEEGLRLRHFLETEVVTGLAYGFRVFRMIGAGCEFDPDFLWVYRLFSFRSGQRISAKRLHFVPIPTEIPRGRWIKTNLRIKHYGASTPQRREARFQKYRQADPRCESQRSYANILQPPSVCRPWVSVEPADSAVHQESLLEFRRLQSLSSGVCDAEPASRLAPLISAIVISRNDEAVIRSCLACLTAERVNGGYEVILVNSGTDRTAEIATREFPKVKVIRSATPLLPGQARNCGLRETRGQVVAFPGSHVTIEPGYLQAAIDAHEMGFAMVSGSMYNRNATFAGWASFFLDSHVTLRGRPSAILLEPPMRCSYLRWPLLQTGGFPEDLRCGEDTVLNSHLFALGFSAYRSQNYVAGYFPSATGLRSLLSRHATRGRAFASILIEGRLSIPAARGTIGKRLRLLAYFAVVYPIRRTARIYFNVIRWGDARERLALGCTFIHVFLAVAAAAAGALQVIGGRSGTPKSQ